jgi:hypothetical protein
VALPGKYVQFFPSYFLDNLMQNSSPTILKLIEIGNTSRTASLSLVTKVEIASLVAAGIAPKGGRQYSLPPLY